jgi:hypothetical protein
MVGVPCNAAPCRYLQYFEAAISALVPNESCARRCESAKDFLLRCSVMRRSNLQSCQPALGNPTALFAITFKIRRSADGQYSGISEARSRLQKAKLSEDPETKGVWQRMAERWLLCAKLAEEDEQSVARVRAQRAASKRHTISGPLSRRN